MLFSEVTVIQADGGLLSKAYVGIRDGRVAYLGTQRPAGDWGEELRGELLLIPGFFNSHTHVPMTLLRGYGDDMTLDRWLNDRIFPFEDKLTGEDVYWGSLLGIAEMLASGTVSFTDMYYFCDRIVQAVEEGRGIYSNIRKAIHYLLSCNIGEIFTIFVATLLNFGQMPLVPVQLLWLNLVTDSLPALALGVEPVEEGVMDQPPRDPSAGLFSRGFSLRLAWQGLMVGGLTLGAYLLGLFHLGAPGMEGAAANTMAFATLTLSQLFHAFNVRSEDQSLLAQGALSNPAMNKAFLAGMVMQLSVLLLPPLQGVFSVCPMDLTQWVTVLALAMAPIPICEAEKALRRRRPEAEEPRQEKEMSAARK